MTPDESTLFNEHRDATRAFLTQRFPTLGERLAREARRLVSRRIPVFPWLQPLETTLAHLAALPVPAQERFQRIEVLHHPVSLPGAGNARRASSTYNPGAMVASRPFGLEAEVQSFPPGGQPLQPHLQQRLQNFVGSATEPIRVHDDEASHALALAQRADAVTIGQHIFFGKDRFRPQEDEGFALLTHEALHVVRAMQPGNAWRRATQAGVQEEEMEATAVESRALAARRNASWATQPAIDPSRLTLQTQAPVLPGSSAPPWRRTVSDAARVSTESTASAPAQQPMRAASDRNIESGVAPPVMPDMDALKRALYRDLMRQIKADMERGG